MSVPYIALRVLLVFAPVIAFSQPRVWVTSSLQRTAPTGPAGSGSSVQLFAGKGEYESFQLVIQAGSAGLSNVNVSVSNLSGPGGTTISNTSFSLFREQYVYVNKSSPNWGGTNQPLGAGWYPDGLIPFNDPSTGAPITGAALQAVPFSLTAARNQPIWVDLLVPRTAVAGAYSGTYSVTSDQGSLTGTVQLTVWHFTLPLKPSLQSAFLYWTADSTAAEEELLRNKISPLRTPPATQATLINGFGLGTNALPYWSGADYSNCTMSAAPSVSQFATSAAAQDPRLAEFDYSADEIGSCPALIPTVKQWAYNMHQAGVRNLVTMAPDPLLYDDGSNTGHSAVDIWTMLPLSYNAAVSQMPAALAKGDSLWSYNALVQDSYSPKWMIDFAPLNFRIQPGFVSQSLGLTGLLYWRVDDWSADPWNQVNNAGTFSSNNYPGEGMLVYPGAQVGISGVAPSMRLKWLRDGVEDYEYVAMLKAAGDGAWASGLAASVGSDWTNWTRDTNLLANVRQQLGMELDRLAVPPVAAPSILTPANSASAVPTTSVLSWAASAGATSYTVSFGTSPNPAVAATTANTSFSPGNLAAGTTYYWSVAATNANGASSSSVSSFTTTLPLPGAPVNSSITNGATGVSATPMLTWLPVSGAVSYAVYFGTSSSPALVATLAGTSYSPGALAPATTYYWKVVATNASGSTTSATWSFTTALSLPGAPVNSSITNGAAGVPATPALTWLPVSGAVSYAVYFGTSPSPALATTVTGTSYTPGALAPGTTYYWKIVATNASGSTTSPTWSFTTALPLPGVPVNSSIANGAVGVAATPTLTWLPASNAASYAVYFGTSSTIGLATTTTGTSFTPGTLATGTTYYWKIVATNASGSTTSPTWSFQTVIGASAAPAATSPLNGATGVLSGSSLAWHASTGATSYDVYFGTTASPSYVATVSGTAYTPAQLSAATTYYWKIVAKNAVGPSNSSVWSFVTVQTLPAAPANPLPANGATGLSTSPALTWASSSGATSYQVYLGTSVAPSLVTTVSGASYSPGPLLAGKTYYWKVVAANTAGSTSSAVWTFTTTSSPNVAPTADSVTVSQIGPSVATFRIAASDANGSVDVAGMGVLINTSFDGQKACWFYYDRTSNSLSLANDSTSSWLSVTTGSSATIGNSQCSISGTGVSAIASGSNGIVLTVTITFNLPSFSGAKNVYESAADRAGLSSGYQSRGNWTVR